MTDESRIQFGTRGQRTVRTDETVVILAGEQGPAGADAPQAVWRGAWDPAVSYLADDLVGYAGDAWISLQGGNIGQVPEAGSAYWDPLTATAAMQTIENGFEDKWDAEYPAREWTDLAFTPEIYNVGPATWTPARLTLVLNTPGAPDPNPVTVFAEGVELQIGSAPAAADRFVELSHLAATGLYLFYYDQTGILQYAVSGGLTQEEIIDRYAFVAAVYVIGATETIPGIAWTDGDAVVIGDERHGRTMDSRTHRYLHSTRGSAYESGMGPTGVVVDGDGSVLANNQIGMEDGVFWDEDLIIALTGSAKPYTCPIIWRDGASGDWAVGRNADSLMWSRINFTTGRAAYNQDLGAGAWQRTEVGNNDFSLMHLYAFNGRDYDGASGISVPKYFLVMGQDTYNTIGNARDGAEVEIAALNTGGLEPLLAEFTAVATFIVQSQNGSAYGGSLRSTDSGADFVDWRVNSAGGSSGSGLPAHSTTHEDGGTDELMVTGLTGLLADPQTPLAHASTHEDGGADEIDVGGLSGVLADPQTPTAHESTHELGGSDVLDVESLATTEFDTGKRLSPDGAGGVIFGNSVAAHAPSHNAPFGTDQLADYVLATPLADGEKGQVPKPLLAAGNSEILHAKAGWALPNAPTKDVHILARSDFVPTGLTDAVYDLLSGVNSILDTPGSPTTLELVGDVGVPGPNQVYGTDGGGAKGWKADPASGSTFPVTSADIELIRQAAHIAALKSGLNPTELQLYNSDDGIGNYERGILRWYLGTDLWIGTDLPGGTGSARKVVFVYNGSPRLTIDNAVVDSSVKLQGPQIESDVATGTAPLIVASTTKVANLNVDQLDDQSGAYYATFEKSGVFLDPAGARDVPVFRAPYACTVLSVRAIRVGGTAATVNARKNGTTEHLLSDLAVGTGWSTGGAIQSGGYSAGDSLELRLKSITGSPTEVTVQVEFVKA